MALSDKKRLKMLLAALAAAVVFAIIIVAGFVTTRDSIDEKQGLDKEQSGAASKDQSLPNKGKPNISGEDQGSAGDERSPETVVEQLGSYLHDLMMADSMRRHWVVLDLKLTLLSEERSGSSVEAIFDIERKYRLSFRSPEDAPIIKGRIAFLEKNDGSLSEGELAMVEADIAKWKNILGGYMREDQQCFDRMKLTGELRADGSLNTDSVKVYAEIDGPTGRDIVYIPYNLIVIPTDEEVESEAFESLRSRINKARQ